MATMIISPETAIAVEISMSTLSANTYSFDVDSAERAEPLTDMGVLQGGGMRSRATASQPASEIQSHETPGTSVSYGARENDNEEEQREDSTKPVSLDAWKRFLKVLTPHHSDETEEEKKAYAIHRGHDRLKIEKVDDFQEGIPQLAALLNSNDSFALFRRFGQLSSRILIHMTIELAELERELEVMDIENAKNGRLQGAGDSNGWGKEHEALVMKIKGRLQEYFALLLQHSQLRAHDQPPPHQPKNLYAWIWDEKPLTEQKGQFINNIGDFISVAQKSEPNTHAANMLESHLDRYPGSPLKWLVQTDHEKEKSDDPFMEHYSPERFNTVVRTISVLVAVSVLLVPVLLLFLVPMSKHLMAWLVFGSVMSFAMILAMLSEAKTHQILIGTAAYGAVLVTFLGSLNRGDGA